jgi:hypothetical protein
MVYNTIVLCSTCLLGGVGCGYDTVMLFIHMVNLNYSKHHENKLFASSASFYLSLSVILKYMNSTEPIIIMCTIYTPHF